MVLGASSWNRQENEKKPLGAWVLIIESQMTDTLIKISPIPTLCSGSSSWQAEDELVHQLNIDLLLEATTYLLAFLSVHRRGRRIFKTFSNNTPEETAEFDTYAATLSFHYILLLGQV